MKRIRVTIYWKTGLKPARYVFDTWNRCFTWLHTYLSLYCEDIAKVTVKRKGLTDDI